MNTTKKYFKYFLSAGRTVHLLWISSVVVIFILEQWLFHVPELFSCAATLGKIVENVGFSVIASVTFYLLVVHIPQSISREGISVFFNSKAKNIVGCCKALHSEFKKQLPDNGQAQSEFLSEGDLLIIFGKLNPASEAPMVLGNGNRANWLEYMAYYKDRSKMFMHDILNVSEYINPELMQLLISIDDCGHFGFIGSFSATKGIANTNMTPWHSTFVSYTKLCQALDLFLKEGKDWRLCFT